MRGITYSKEEKEKVRQAILSGKSYNEITEFLGVPKSTISTWFGKTLKKPMNRGAMLKHLAEIRKLSAIKVRNKWKKIRDDEDKNIAEFVKKELPTYPFDNMGFYKSMLSMLYWAEGAKHEGACGLKFVNTDPLLMNLYITLLRKCYNIDEKKLKVRVHVHYYHSIKKVKKFWSENLNIPLNQFGKIYIKKRSKTKKFRKNFVGICFVYYGNSRIRKEVMEIARKLQSTIK